MCRCFTSNSIQFKFIKLFDMAIKPYYCEMFYYVLRRKLLPSGVLDIPVFQQAAEEEVVGVEQRFAPSGQVKRKRYSANSWTTDLVFLPSRTQVEETSGIFCDLYIHSHTRRSYQTFWLKFKHNSCKIIIYDLKGSATNYLHHTRILTPNAEVKGQNAT